MYTLDLGPHEQKLAKQYMRAGEPIPERIANAPELMIGLQFYMQAFFDLDSERSHAMAPTAIPRSKIRDYAEAYECDDETTEDLMFLIRKMDNKHLERIAAKVKKPDGKPK